MLIQYLPACNAAILVATYSSSYAFTSIGMSIKRTPDIQVQRVNPNPAGIQTQVTWCKDKHATWQKWLMYVLILGYLCNYESYLLCLKNIFALFRNKNLKKKKSNSETRANSTEDSQLPGKLERRLSYQIFFLHLKYI